MACKFLNASCALVALVPPYAMGKGTTAVGSSVMRRGVDKRHTIGLPLARVLHPGVHG